MAFTPTPNDATCKHCEHAIVYNRNTGKWVDPDDETRPGICPANSSLGHPHEPRTITT